MKNGVPQCVCSDQYEGLFCHLFNGNFTSEETQIKGIYIAKTLRKKCTLIQRYIQAGRNDK